MTEKEKEKEKKEKMYECNRCGYRFVADSWMPWNCPNCGAECEALEWS